MLMKKINLGIIGLGRMGGYHASVSQLIPNINLVGIADPNESNWSKIKYSKTIKTSNYLDWIDNVDGVIIAVPTNMHFAIAKNCLLKNKHVLLEKPLTKTVEQATELFELAKEKKLALHVGHVERFNGAIQELKKIINKPYLIEAQRIGPFVPSVRNDSVILDLMIHDLDIVLNLVDSELSSFHVSGRNVNTKSCDIAIVQLKFKNGVIANITSSRTSHIKKRTMTIHQKDSFINLDFTTQNISIHKNTSDDIQIGKNELKYKKIETVEHLHVYKDNPLKLEIEHFANSIRTMKKLTQPKQDIKALELTLKLEKELGL